ncbi:MAG TPA: hypothetical protein VHL58_02465 [Thermoanaerobaculia bacterium]|nr:hypothetical protein [Thermoanaerobaculia bacterium]
MSDGPKATGLGKLVILVFVGACVFGAWRLLSQKKIPNPFAKSGASPTATGDAGSFAPSGEIPEAEIGIAYGTEKEQWLKAGLGAETAYLYLMATNTRFQNLVDSSSEVSSGDSTEQTRRALDQNYSPASTASTTREIEN